MTISFACPHCSTQTEVAQSDAGKVVPCSRCGQSVTIPGDSDPSCQPASITPQRHYSRGARLVAVVLASAGALLLCGGIVVALLLPALQAPRITYRRDTCTNSMRQIVLALHNYHDVHYKFPPAYTTDEQGNPLHSWRVLILPYMEEQTLYDQIDLMSPWDSPANQLVADQMPYCYACPSSRSDPNETNYMVIVGKNTAFQPGKGRQMKEFTDGLSNTILVVEVVGPSVNWMEPKDLQADQMSYIVNGGPGEISSEHVGIANVVFADRHAAGISPEEIAPETLKGLTTINGGETVDLDF